MPSSPEQIIRDLTAVGLVSSDEVTQFASQHTETGAEQLLAALVEAGKITQYQADRFGQGSVNEIAFGDYIVIDEIGKGGMGTVLLARHRRMDREVAIKVLQSTALESDIAVSRFYQEVKVAAQLNHPNIVHAYDAGEHHGFHYLVMEYVIGNDLSKVLAERGVLPLDQALEFIIQAAEGLKYAHRKGVVHRDIKPSNLLLDDEGVIKILDMGLARIGTLSESDGPSLHLTTTGQVMGTVDFMAPEQAEDTRNADHRSDIYSLGCTLFRFVTGQSPFSRDTIVKTILAHRESKPPQMGFQPHSNPGGALAQSVFEKMIAKSPADRYQDCESLLVDLRNAMQLAGSRREELTIQSNAGRLGTMPVQNDSPTMERQSSAPPSSDAARSSAPANPSGSAGQDLATSQVEIIEDVEVLAPISPPPTTIYSGEQSNVSIPNFLVPETGNTPTGGRGLLIVSCIGLALSLCAIGLLISVGVYVKTRFDLQAIESGEKDGQAKSSIKMAQLISLFGIAIGLLVLVGNIIALLVNN